ncbi:MFS transporter [Rugosimonospora acidiphila]|uniref:MFS transporter n=2 Tax=Rugosimonospora acidiphila TaxID=556531 RepID=A0ABP9SVK8_9ACTN
MGTVVSIISSLGAPLIPTVAADDHVSLGAAQWSLTITFLVSALATPLMGRLGDGPHRRTVIIGSLGVVTLGAVLAALPFGFVLLLVGRGLQGVGLGLTPLGIAVARDTLPPDRGRSTTAMLSITTVAGLGLGYPITGLIADHGGLHAAFWFGAACSAAALVVAALVVPSSAHHPRQRLDVLGAVLLGAALAGLLLAISEGEGWGWGSARLLGVVAVALAALAGWILLELRRSYALVQLRLLSLRAVLTGNVGALFAGIAMYLLISLVTRFVQTPASSGYGLGASAAVSGLVLLPFSAGSVVANRITHTLIRRTSAEALLSVGSAVGLIATLLFTFARASLWEVATLMGIAGLGVGIIFAVMPSLIVGAVPRQETGSATSFNQVIRYVGYAAGSAMSAVVLEARTVPGHLLPAAGGYTVAGLIGCGVWVVTAVVSLALPRLPHNRTTTGNQS